jgi:exosome complex component CSL4
VVLLSKQEIVVPGSFLSTEEEFLAGQHAFESENGNVYSNSVGEAEFNLDSREVSIIKKTRPLKKLSCGATVIGVVVLLKDVGANIEILSAEKDGEKLVTANEYAFLSISNLSNSYVEDIREMLRIGDIVKARVVELTQHNIALSIKDRDLGVLKAYCIRCRKPLQSFEGKLKCVSCGKPQSRKVSSDYLVK